MPKREASRLWLGQIIIYNLSDRLVGEATAPAYYNQHRPHRSLDQQPPADGVPQLLDHPLRTMKSTRCNGLINQYRNAA